MGTDISGIERLGSATFTAIQILSDNNLIGDRFFPNLIVGGSHGIDIQSGNGNVIQNNFIGVDISGEMA